MYSAGRKGRYADTHPDLLPIGEHHSYVLAFLVEMKGGIINAKPVVQSLPTAMTNMTMGECFEKVDS